MRGGRILSSKVWACHPRCAAAPCDIDSNRLAVERSRSHGRRGSTRCGSGCSGIAQRSNVVHQFYSHRLEESPRSVIILFLLGNREVICHSVKMIHEGPAYLFVRGGSGPKIERRPTGNARHARKRRDAKLLVFLDQQARPAFQVLEKPIDLGVQFVATGDLSGRLLDVLDHVNNVTQHAVEGGDRIVW
jgi:hypothetical protein